MHCFGILMAYPFCIPYSLLFHHKFRWILRFCLLVSILTWIRLMLKHLGKYRIYGCPWIRFGFINSSPIVNRPCLGFRPASSRYSWFCWCGAMTTRSYQWLFGGMEISRSPFPFDDSRSPSNSPSDGLDVLDFYVGNLTLPEKKKDLRSLTCRWPPHVMKSAKTHWVDLSWMGGLGFVGVWTVLIESNKSFKMEWRELGFEPYLLSLFELKCQNIGHMYLCFC